MSENPVSRRRFLIRVLCTSVLLFFGDSVLTALRLSSRGAGNGSAHAVVANPADSFPCPEAECLPVSHRETLEALASVIVPTDDDGPGAREAGVAREIERLLERSPVLRQRYLNGLQAFDELAGHRYQRRLSQLPAQRQAELFSLVETARQRLWPEAAPSRIYEKVEWKLQHWYYRRYVGITDPMMVLQEQLTRDVLESFYASKVAWDSVGYTGPPFPFGYVGRRSVC